MIRLNVCTLRVYTHCLSDHLFDICDNKKVQKEKEKYNNNNNNNEKKNNTAYVYVLPSNYTYFNVLQVVEQFDAVCTVNHLTICI